MRITCMIVDEQCQFSLAGRCGLQLREPPHVRELLAHIGECLAAFTSRIGLEPLGAEIVRAKHVLNIVRVAVIPD